MYKKIKILQFKDILSHADVVKSARRNISFALEIFKKKKPDAPEIASYLKEIKEAAKALKDSENVLADLAVFNYNLIDVSPIGIASYDGISGDCLAGNDAFSKIIGTGNNDILKQNFRKITSWKKSGLLKDAEATLLNGKIHHKEICITTSFGKNVWIDYRFARFSSNGQPHLLFLVHDITERKQSEIALQESESSLLAIFENTSEGFILTDTNGIVKAYNNKSKETILLNVEKEINTGDSLFDFIHESRKGYYDDAISKVLSGETLQYDYPYERANGELKWYNFTVSPVYAGNLIEGLCITSADITGRKQSEQLLKESEVFNKGILASLSSHIAVVDESGVIIAVNKAWNDFAKANGSTCLERSAEGSNYFDVCNKAIAAGDIIAGEALAGILSVLRKEKRTFELEYPCNSPSEQRWYELHVMNFGTSESKIVISHQNITERKKAEASLLFSQSNLKAIIENTDAAIYSLDKKLRYITFNKRLQLNMQEMYGLEIRAGDHVFDFLKKLDTTEATAWHKVYSKALKGETVKFEKEFNFDAIYTCISFSIHPIWENDNVIGLSCFALDITKKKQAEDALQQSEFRYRQIVETAQEGIWLIDENSITTFVNKKMSDILGYSQEEMYGKENYFFMDDSGKRAALSSMDRGRKGIKEEVELCLITKTGRTIVACISANPIFDDVGAYKGALGMVSDITEKKNLEDLLDKTNKLARIGSWEIDVIKGNVYWSKITREIHEVAPDFVPDPDKIMNYFKDGNDREVIRRCVKKCIENGVPWDEELQIITQKGNLKWIRTIGEAKFKDDVCIKIYGSFQDIDTGKNAEMEILKAYEEKNIILESIGDAFFAVDKNWKVTYWNRQAEKILHGPKEEMLGKLLWEIFPKSIDSLSYKEYYRAIETDQVTHFEDYYEPLAKWYEISAYPSLNGLSVYFKDITDKKILRQQLLEEQLNKQKEITKAVVNAQEKERSEIGEELHDNINQLLAASKLYLGHALSKPGNKDEEIVKSQEFIMTAMDEIRKLSHVLVGPTQNKTIGLINSLRELIADMNLLKGLKISFNTLNYQEDESEVGLKLVIFRIIQGQLNNIMKHAAASEIEIGLNKEGNDLVVIINDNGKGFNTSAKIKGIGLQNIRNRAELYNGIVEITSSPGNGCKMKIIFRDIVTGNISTVTKIR